ncbi:MAG: radical SAM protein [Candidatus Omnitrophota bacterium]
MPETMSSEKQACASLQRTNPLNRFFYFPLLCCNNDCLHCLALKKSKGNTRTFTHAVDGIRKHRKRFSKISIGGGEPTLWSGLVPLIRYCKGLRFRVQLHSNCRRMAVSEFASGIVKAGIDGITVPLHAHTQALHDTVTRRKGSFSETIRGIENLQKCGFKNIHVMVVAHRLNYRILPEIAAFLCKRRIKTVSFEATVFTGNAVKNFSSIAVKLSRAAPYLETALELLSHRNVELFSSSFPFCIIKRRYWRFLLNMRYSRVVTNLSKSRADNSGYRYQDCGTGLAKICAACKAKLFCPGTWHTYYRFFGDREFKPLKTVAMADIVRSVSDAGIKNIFDNTVF